MDSRRRFDAVVIGSGFGGSISARRLAEAGRSVLVLERGKRYRPSDFPRDVTDIDAVLWRYPDHTASRGLYDVRFFSGIAAIVASGVGGGSLVYANVHIRPDPIIFEDPRWPRSLNRQTLDPYYDRVATALGVSPLPEDRTLAKRDVFRRAAEQLGKPVFDPDLAVAWTDPGVPGRRACQMVAECEFGCPHGAKNTMDLTYLAEAERLGASVRSDVQVTHVEAIDGGYRVHYEDAESGEYGSAVGRRVVVAAGALGTTELLLRSRDVYRTLPRLSRRLGHGFSGNGDFLGSIENSREDLEPWEGPDVTSVIRYFDAAPEFTLAAPTFNRQVTAVLASLGQGSGRELAPLAPLLWPALGRLIPLALRKGLFSRPLHVRMPNAGEPGRFTNLFAIGRDNANGRMVLKRGRLDITWEYERENRALVARMTQAMEALADAYGGTFAPLLTWNIFKRIATVHALGGCRLAETANRGVVSPDGEVHGYPGLFVADGSVIPTAIGFHPVMTICAIAELIAERVVASDN